MTTWVPAEPQEVSQWGFILGFLLTSLSSYMVSAFLLYDKHAEESTYLSICFLIAAMEK